MRWRTVILKYYGRSLFERDIPGIRKALERIADALEDKQRINRILNTLKNSTVEDIGEVIDAIEKDEKI